MGGSSHSDLCPTPSPLQSRTTVKPAEPSFDEFLFEPEPLDQPLMPPNRPKKSICYFNRDDRYSQTLQKLLHGIVLLPPLTLLGKLGLDKVALTVATSAKVSPTQLQVAGLSKDRFLVLLPPTVDRDDVITAIPKNVWDDGFKFQSYSPLSDASISLPFFKIWIDISGVPLELGNEACMARAISSFGIYLGSMEPRIQGDCHTWSVFLATDDLALIPHEIDLKIGGMVHTATISPRKWLKKQVYHRSDLPPATICYQPPITPPPSPSTSPTTLPPVNPAWFQGDDVMRISLKVLREIFKDLDPSCLPDDLAACLAGNADAIAANHAAYSAWEQQNREIRIPPQPPH